MRTRGIAACLTVALVASACSTAAMPPATTSSGPVHNPPTTASIVSKLQDIASRFPSCKDLGVSAPNTGSGFPLSTNLADVVAISKAGVPRSTVELVMLWLPARCTALQYVLRAGADWGLFYFNVGEFGPGTYRTLDADQAAYLRETGMFGSVRVTPHAVQRPVVP
jgi:hypothetical protein